MLHVWLLQCSGLKCQRTQCHFAAHGELALNILAREWCRRGNHFFTAWLGPGGLETLRGPEQHPYIGSLEFLEWAVEVDIASATFAKLQEVRRSRPVLTPAPAKK